MKKCALFFLLLCLLGGLMAQPQMQIKPVPAWSSFLGCIAGCSDYLECGYSPDWIWGVTGYAFLMNIFPGVCPSGPTAFDNSFLKENAKNLGLLFQETIASKNDPNFSAQQKAAFDQVKAALAKNLPSFAFELGIEEYYLIMGTDETGYLYADFDGQSKHCDWDSLGVSEIGMLEVITVERANSFPEARSQVKGALDFFRAYQSDPAKYALPKYTMGLPAYDVWIRSLEEGEVDQLGLPYNSRIWCEARYRAAAFLNEIREKLGAGYDYASLDQASQNYEKVAEALEGLCGLYAFPPNPEDFTPENAARAVELLSQAKAAETAGVELLLDFARQF